MAAKATQISQAVTEHLETAGLDIMVERKSGSTTLKMGADTNTHCFVYPGGTSVTAETRQWSSREITVFVHVLRFLDEEDEVAQGDNLLELVESIEDRLNNVTLGGFQFLQFASDSSSRELLDPDTQTARFMFETLLQVTYTYAN